jgi:hypothetical protein
VYLSISRQFEVTIRVHSIPFIVQALSKFEVIISRQFQYTEA